MDLPVGAAVSSLDWDAPVLTEVGLYTIEVPKGDPSPALLRPQANLDMSQSFLSDLDSSKRSSQRASCNLKNIFPVSTTDHLSSATLGVSEQIERQKYLSCHCLRKFPFLHFLWLFVHFHRWSNTSDVLKTPKAETHVLWQTRLVLLLTKSGIWKEPVGTSPSEKRNENDSLFMVTRWAQIYTKLIKRHLTEQKQSQQQPLAWAAGSHSCWKSQHQKYLLVCQVTSRHLRVR